MLFHTQQDEFYVNTNTNARTQVPRDEALSNAFKKMKENKDLNMWMTCGEKEEAFFHDAIDKDKKNSFSNMFQQQRCCETSNRSRISVEMSRRRRYAAKFKFVLEKSIMLFIHHHHHHSTSFVALNIRPFFASLHRAADFSKFLFFLFFSGVSGVGDPLPISRHHASNASRMIVLISSSRFLRICIGYMIFLIELR